MGIFKIACKRGGKYLAKIEFEGKDKWFTATKAVYTYASKNFEEGQDVDIEYNVQNGQYFVTKIMNAGSGTKSTSAPETKVSDGKPTCEDCGKELKDSKYTKCYECNQKARKSSGGKTYGKDSVAIQKESVLHSCAIAVGALAGLVDPNNIGDVLESLYDRMYKKLFG